MGSGVTSASDFPFDKFDYRYLSANLKYNKLEGKAIQFMTKEEINVLIKAVWYSFPEVTREICAGQPKRILPDRPLEKNKP